MASAHIRCIFLMRKYLLNADYMFVYKRCCEDFTIFILPTMERSLWDHIFNVFFKDPNLSKKFFFSDTSRSYVKCAPLHCYTWYLHYSGVFRSYTHLDKRKIMLMRPFFQLIWKTKDKRRSTNMSELVTCAFSSISLKSIFTRALIRSQGIVACRVTLTAMFTRQALVYVYKRKE